MRQRKTELWGEKNLLANHPKWETNPEIQCDEKPQVCLPHVSQLLITQRLNKPLMIE